MRAAFTIPHPYVKITVFHWNEKYLVEMEASTFKQTYKLPSDDFPGEESIRKFFNDDFMESVMNTFEHMHKTFHARHKSIQV